MNLYLNGNQKIKDFLENCIGSVGIYDELSSKKVLNQINDIKLISVYLFNDETIQFTVEIKEILDNYKYKTQLIEINRNFFEILELLD